MSSPQDLLFELVETEAPVAQLREAMAAEGVDLDAVHNYAALHLAADRLNVDHVAALLAAGADPNRARANGDTPMGMAFVRDPNLSSDALASELETCGTIIDLLLAHGGRLQANTNLPALFSAQVPEMVDLLVARGADPMERGPGGDTALHRAVLRGETRLAERLLAHGASATAVNERGESPGMLAAIALRDAYGELRCVQAERVQEVLTAAGATAPEPVVLLEASTAGAGLLKHLTDRPWYSLNDLARGVHGHSEVSDSVRSFRAVLAALVAPRQDLTLAAASVTFPLFVNGDLTVDGDLSVRGSLVVTGNLRVSGRVDDERLTRSSLLVGGDLHGAALITSSEVRVLGRLIAKHFVYGHGNDCVLFADTIETPLLLSKDHHIEARERATERDMEVHGLDPSDTDFVSEVLHRDRLDPQRLYQHLCAGRSAFRG